jgi:hypothetical protein
MRCARAVAWSSTTGFHHGSRWMTEGIQNRSYPSRLLHQRRHYERMPRFPEGLAVEGDAWQERSSRDPGPSRRPETWASPKWRASANRFQQLAGYDEEADDHLRAGAADDRVTRRHVSPRMVLKVLTVRPDKAAQTPGPQPLAASTTREA